MCPQGSEVEARKEGQFVSSPLPPPLTPAVGTLASYSVDMTITWNEQENGLLVLEVPSQISHSLKICASLCVLAT